MITNPAADTIKRIKALRQRKERTASGHYWIEGIRIVGEAAQLNAPIQQLVVAPDLLTSGFARELVDSLAARRIPVVEVSTKVFESLSDKEGPQGIGAVLKQTWSTLSTITPAQTDLWIALDSAQDPGNIGTILRTGDATAAQGLILVGDSADPYDLGALRASMGAVYSLKLIKTQFRDLVNWKLQHDLQMIGTSDRGATDYREIEYRTPLILFMGSERQGLPDEYMAACDAMARLPMRGRSDSLNLAVATGVMLYAIRDRTD